MDDPGPQLQAPDERRARGDAPTRGDWVRHVLLLVWGALMLGIVLAGVIGFLVHFFLLQR